MEYRVRYGQINIIDEKTYTVGELTAMEFVLIA
jgi:hypothetical protein